MNSWERPDEPVDDLLNGQFPAEGREHHRVNLHGQALTV
ncbi:hypothetical protein P3T30_006622 [Kitasatospora sp. MAP12-9]|nr:hypothetical protein [Kitasatospora sp. MAP12-44]